MIGSAFCQIAPGRIGVAGREPNGTRQMDQRFEGLGVPADGTSAATDDNGDFGTSPIFGQLLDKPRLACVTI
jgi:hypothetical protein